MRRQENLLKKTDPSADKIFYDLTDRDLAYGVIWGRKWVERANGAVQLECVYFVGWEGEKGRWNDAKKEQPHAVRMSLSLRFFEGRRRSMRAA